VANVETPYAQLAKVHWDVYKAHIDAGFEKGQALAIVLALTGRLLDKQPPDPFKAIIDNMKKNGNVSN
jgi:hypothetical protein